MKHKTIVEIEKIEIFCDICNKPAKSQCSICNLDICLECTIYDNDLDYGDYAPKYCQSCWKEGSSYRSMMLDTKEKMYKKIEILTKQWHDAALRKKSL